MDKKPDEHAGMGGSYTLDPKTGKRTLVHRTAPPDPAQPQPQAQAAPADAEATLPPAPRQDALTRSNTSKKE